MAITGGFGFEYDILSGITRRWYMGKDGVRRFAHNDQPCDLPGVNNFEYADENDQPAAANRGDA